MKAELQELEQRFGEAEARRKALLDRVPNPPAEDTPDGATEEDAVVVKLVGDPPAFSFEPRDHLDLAAAHGWIDVERAARVSGSRFVYRVGDVALLEIALYRWALARIVQKGHVPMLPPVLVREEAMYGTGFFPIGEGRLLRGARGRGSISSAPRRFRWPRSTWARRSTGCRSATWRLSTCFAARQAPPAATRAGCSVCTSSTRSEMFVFCEPESLARGARAAARDRGGAGQGARAALPRAEHRRRRPRLLGGEEVRHRGVVPGTVPLSRDHVDLEHDRLPGPAPERPLPPRRQGSSTSIRSTGRP